MKSAILKKHESQYTQRTCRLTERFSANTFFSSFKALSTLDVCYFLIQIIY
ncbi:unnamed protein product [Nezara viridula]|uniref:Uncharacterized protein n=1 Tax=Nezara viridula TaxID=85310 RepID=A0A9P0HDD5_NEZVI|nr:unnamed protein product [Nezara viridula]